MSTSKPGATRKALCKELERLGFRRMGDEPLNPRELVQTYKKGTGRWFYNYTVAYGGVSYPCVSGLDPMGWIVKHGGIVEITWCEPVVHSAQ